MTLPRRVEAERGLSQTLPPRGGMRFKKRPAHDRTVSGFLGHPNNQRVSFHGPVYLRPCVSASAGLLDRIVVAHAATYGGMLTNFGARCATKVVDEGGRLHFFASSSPIYGLPPPVDEFEKIGGVFHGLNIPRLPSPFLDLAALVRMTLGLRRYRVQVLHTRSIKMGAIGVMAGRLAGVPIVVHHQDDLCCRDERLGLVAKWFAGKVEWALSTLVDKSLFISDAVLRDALRIGFSPDKCVNVGMDLNPVLLRVALREQIEEKVRLPLLRDLGIPKSALLVGSIGRLVPEKGFDILLRAAKRVCSVIADSYFVIMGDGPLRSELESIISDSGLAGRVFLYTKRLSQVDVPDLYRSLDVFALATRREGFGMVFAEAMAFGVPVVGPNMEPVSEVMGPGCGVLVGPENVGQYADAIIGLLKAPAVRREMGRRGRELALSRWSGEVAADKVVRIYDNLLSSKGLRTSPPSKAERQLAS